MSLTVSHIFVHPVKSMAGQSVAQAAVTADGLVGDRQFVIVSETGKCRTARECPSLVLVKAFVLDGTLTLTAPDDCAVSVRVEKNVQASQRLKVWQDDVTGADMGDEVAEWLTAYLGRGCRLLAIADDSVRKGRFKGTPKAFSDASPLLLTTEASLGDLNSRLAHGVTQRNFRPNIVIAGSMEPFGEDLWAEVRIGDLRMDVAWGCARCILTTVDPQTGEKSLDMEPVKTLKAYRSASDKQFYFGQNIIPRQAGIIHVGDSVEILSTHKHARHMADGLL